MANEPQFEIRPAASSDEAECAAIAALSAEADAAAHWSAAQFRDILNSPSRLVLVAKAKRPNGDAKIIGFVVAGAVATDWEIENLAVAPAHRRLGVARSLIQHLLRVAEQRGMRAIFLEVRESNAAARALYESFGFVAEGRRKGYYRAPLEDAVRYAKRQI